MFPAINTVSMQCTNDVGTISNRRSLPGRINYQRHLHIPRLGNIPSKNRSQVKALLATTFLLEEGVMFGIQRTAN